MAASVFGGVRLRITAYSQNLREYASDNQTSGIHETLSEISISEIYDFLPLIAIERVPKNIDFVHAEIPRELSEKLREARMKASIEVTPK